MGDGNCSFSCIAEGMGCNTILIHFWFHRYVYFNACIFNEKLKQIWWGDIDITKDKKALRKIAKESKELFYVTPEHPFRSDFNKVDQKLIDTDESVIKYNALH